jgi:hypothetical protein
MPSQTRSYSSTLEGATIVLGAFLLFQLQPIIAADILPWFGGSAAVWTVCILFFQTALLLGYAYAHVVGGDARPRAALVHLALLVASLVVLPVVPSPRWKPHGDDDPALRLLALLTTTVGLPYFLLSTTGPLVQRWLVRRDPGAQPYRLFALGNLAALAALLTYPFVLQPRVGIGRQITWWSGAYAAYVALTAAVTFLALRAPATPDEDGPRAATPAFVGSQLAWVALSACPSVLLLAVTNHVTKNVAPVPFVWVFFLSVYLITFVLAFDHPRWYRPAIYRPLVVVAFAAACLALQPSTSLIGVRGAIAAFGVVLFVCCMTCHGELASMKPHPRHLTRFYLMVALGGALGGAFVGLVAPRVFVTYFELPLAMVGSVVLVLVMLYRERPQDRRRRGRVVLVAPVIPLLVYLAVRARQIPAGTRVGVRNFFGTLLAGDLADGPGPRRLLWNGGVIHGVQFLDGNRRREPTAYYGRTSGVGRVLARLGSGGPLRVGVVGLGAGVLAAYGRSGDYYRFYEINPMVVLFARSEFTFLGDDAAAIDVVVGDGRVELEGMRDAPFDVLVLDAFSGDSIPVHLLTVEAFATYFTHIAPSGILAVHVSNAYLDLAPIAARVASALGRRAFLVTDDGDPAFATCRSVWVLVPAAGDLPLGPEFASAVPIAPVSGVEAWTDDYSNLLEAVR